MAATFTILGVDDEVAVCERCGKKNLKRTVALEMTSDDGDTTVVRYGCDCAARALKGREVVSRKEASEVERRALAIMLRAVEAEVRPVLHVTREERPEAGMTFVRVPAGLARAGQKWGRAFAIAGGRTYLHFDYVVSSPAAAGKLVPGVWIMLAESRFVGVRS